MSKWSFVVELFERIHESKIQQEQRELFKQFIYLCPSLLSIIFILCWFQCHNSIYNAWVGPFHFNRDKFIDHLKVHYGNAPLKRLPLLSLFSFDKEYLQIELGEDQIDGNLKRIYRAYYRHFTDGNLLNIFYRIKDQSMTTLPKKLFVKLPTSLQSHFHYRFELFSLNTLKCIVRQIGIPSNSIHIEAIKKIYAQNATDFNMKTIIKCGILLGYIHDYRTETFYQPCEFTSLTAVFDTSYLPYKTYLFGPLLLWCLMKIFVYLLLICQHLIYRFGRIISPDVQHALCILEITSIEILDYLLLIAEKENNFCNNLFLIQDQYFIIFKISLNERNPKILCQYYMTPPFIIINVATIIAITSDYIFFSTGRHLDKILLPTIDHNNDAGDWLYRRLMNCDENYRQ
jgi:hypothetical protein